jgi:hypothetical protein
LRHIEQPAALPVSRLEIERMERAAAEIAECRRWLATHSRSVLGEIIADPSAICDWRHYPDGEVYDPATHAQYFYHTHSAIGRPAGEHGHFHTFLRAEGMPSGVAPLILPELAVANVRPPQAAPLKRGAKDEVSHLVAIAIDARGEPIRLSTTNRWVTGETWFRADDVVRMLDRFAFKAGDRTRILDRWVAALVQLFSPQIAALLRARDETVMSWRRRRRTNVFDDPRLEVTSSLEVDLVRQLALLDRLRSPPAIGSRPCLPGLPSMADGWD